MGMAAPIYYTADMVRALPDDGNRHEVVHGELLVTPAPRPWHEVIVGRLSDALRAYLRSEPVGFAFASRSDISWGSDTMVEPDVLVVPLEQARTLEWARMKNLLLVAEVLSPSSMRADRFTKRVEYQRQGMPVYWVVDADERRVEIWRPGDTFPRLSRSGSSGIPRAPLSLSVSRLRTSLHRCDLVPVTVPSLSLPRPARLYL